MKRSITSFLLYSIIFLMAGVSFLSSPAVFAKEGAESADFFTSYSQSTVGMAACENNGESFEISNTPNDNYYKYQWYLEKIKAPQAWDHIKESPGTTIAVIDTGVQVDHPDLKDNIWTNSDEIPGNGKDDDNNGFIDDVHGWDFVTNSPDPSPDINEDYSQAGLSHGTIVAGIAAANGNNEIGITGITWQTQIMPLRVLDGKGQGGANRVIRAIDYAIDNGVDIINLSFVGPGRSDSMHEAIMRAHKAGVMVVAAAGNEKSHGEGYNLNETPMYPVCYDREYEEDIIIGVGSTDTLDQKASFSSYGQGVDIMAPGKSIFSTVFHDPEKEHSGECAKEYYDGFWAGTSMAAPMVSGTLSLIKAANPELNNEQVRDVLLESADNIDKLNPRYYGEIGDGRLNVKNAVKKSFQLSKDKNTKVLLSPASRKESEVKIADYSNEVITTLEAFPFDFRGGINAVGGDLDGNKEGEIVVGAGEGGGPQIRIFSSSGNLKEQFFAYTPFFRGGVNVATGDVDGDGEEEIITGAGPGGGPHVRVFNNKGEVEVQFFAYDNQFRGGVKVTSGDVNGDGKEEIITGPGQGTSPRVKVFNNKGENQFDFLAYTSSFQGGVDVAAANIKSEDYKNKEEIIVAPGEGGGPHIRVFNDEPRVLGQFFAYDESFRGGVNVSAGDINKDGFAEIVTGAGPGGGPHTRYFNIQGKIVNSFYAYDKDFMGGVNVGLINIE